MTQALELLSLQGIDDELSTLQAHLTEVRHRLEGDEALRAIRERRDGLQLRLAEIQKRQRSLDARVQDAAARIAKEEARLYDGSIKNPKELVSLQHEIEALKAANSAVEDELLGVLSEMEQHEAELRDVRTSVAALEERWAEASAALHAEAVRLEQALTKATARRIAQVEQVTPGSLSLYEGLRKRRDGTAVARIVGSGCSRCRITLPDAVRRKAMSPAGLTQCPNCERVLVAG